MTSPELLREASIIDYLGGTPAGTMRTTTRSIWDDHLDSPLSLTSSSNWALAPRRVELLRDCVENADDAEGLPEALTHSNYHVWAAVGAPGNLVVVGWAGSGRGPRLPALAWLLRTAAEGRPEFIDAVMRGYSEHVTLTDDELERLPGVLNMRPLWLACLEYRGSVRRGQTPVLGDGWEPSWAVARPEHAERIAARAIAARPS